MAKTNQLTEPTVETQQDAILKDYFRHSSHCADLINGTIFQGNHYLTQYDIEPDKNTDMSTVFKDDEKNIYVSFNRYRNFMALCHYQQFHFYLGIEFESTDNNNAYSKATLYDWSAYNQPKNDFHAPVLTMILNTSLKKWYSKTSIRQKYFIPKLFEEYFNDWMIPVFSILDLDLKNFHDKDNLDLIRLCKAYYKYGNNLSYKEFESVTKEVLLVFGTIANFREEALKRFDQRNINGGVEGMSLIFEEQWAAVEVDGINKGISNNILKLIKYCVKAEPSQSVISAVNNGNDVQLDNLMMGIVDGRVKSEADVLSYFGN